MEALLAKIKTLSREEVDEVMEAVENWFQVNYPNWDVVYIALPKNPVERKERFQGMLRLIAKDLQWNEENYTALP